LIGLFVFLFVWSFFFFLSFLSFLLFLSFLRWLVLCMLVHGIFTVLFDRVTMYSGIKRARGCYTGNWSIHLMSFSFKDRQFFLKYVVYYFYYIFYSF
jgi:hypothetical protein